jgi:hypothetical protein
MFMGETDLSPGMLVVSFPLGTCSLGIWDYPSWLLTMLFAYSLDYISVSGAFEKFDTLICMISDDLCHSSDNVWNSFLSCQHQHSR